MRRSLCPTPREQPWQHPAFPAGALTWWTALLLGCGSPEVRDIGYDGMFFADESAIESIPAVRVVLPRRPGQGHGRAADPALPWSEGEAPRHAICSNPRDEPSRSVGRATDGSLENGCRIPASGAGWVAVNGHAWGSDEMVGLLQWAARQVAQQYPGSAPVVIGGLSDEDGGFLPPHKSHQSGRDADIAYFRNEGQSLRRLQLCTPGDLDTEKTWALLEALLYTGEVMFVFMDYELQARLYADLLDLGWTEESLAVLFQYPAGPGVPRGVIRHARGHADHFHIRFRCPRKDRPDCED